MTTACIVSLLLWAAGPVAFATLTTTGDSVTFTEGAGEDCNGVIPPQDERNTKKTLVGGELVAGGWAEYRISYPVTAGDEDDRWVVTDCVIYGTGSNLKQYDELLKGEFVGVPNDEHFTFTFTVQLPEDLPLGTRVCNVAKTTAGPSAAPASFRKGGPACFTVGGDARVEKHSTTDRDGEPIGGATFEISDCVNSADDPAIEPIIVTPEPEPGPVEGSVVAEDGTIAFSGPSGSTCIVTETAPPPGYALPPADERSITITIPAGTTATVYNFYDPPLPEDASVSVVAGECVYAEGDSTTEIDITISPAGSATVTIFDGEGTEVGTFTESGTFPAPPGSYTWTAEAAEGYELTSDDRGEFTADDCAPGEEDASATLAQGRCVFAEGASTTPLSVTISPAGSVTVTVTDSTGHETELTSSSQVTLPPGAYTWTAEAADGYTLTTPARGGGTAGSCPEEIDASSSARVEPGQCDFEDGESFTPVSVSISPAGVATVTLLDAEGNTVGTFTSSGSAPVGVGSFTWTADANDGFVLTGASSGRFETEECAEVEGVRLAKTGVDVHQILTMGAMLLLLGGAMLTIARRREEEAAA